MPVFRMPLSTLSRLFVGTWNVNGQAAGSTGLSDWLSCDAEAPQLYAVGFQELDLSKEALLFADSPREEEWLTCVAMGLHPGEVHKPRHPPRSQELRESWGDVGKWEGMLNGVL